MIKNLVERYSKYLDDKKPQTTYKIKYVKEYVKNWLYVMSNRQEQNNINFIDCMCNAGIYKDGDCSTAVEVLNLFIEFSRKHKDKTYNLFLNDFDKDKIKIMKEVCDTILINGPDNIKIYFNEIDVNDYILSLIKNNVFFIFPHSTILFVDPYNFGTVNIPISRVFIEKDKIEEVDSKKHIILQCIDVIVGCIDFVLNEGIITTVRGRAKNEVARFIIKNIHELKENFILTKTTRPTAGFEAWNLKYSHFVYRKKEPPTLLLKSSTQRVAIR